jgi:hypothetical protein
MTAVEWLVEQLPIYGYNVVTVYPELIEQAKEMEKQQIIDAFDKAYPYDVIGYDAGGQYYKETFNNK